MAFGAADPSEVFVTLGVSKFVGALDGRESVVVHRPRPSSWRERYVFGRSSGL